MSSIYRPTYRKDGKLKRVKKWYLRYRDHDGNLKTVPGFTDKGATQQLAAKLEREAAMIRAGLLEPAILFQNVTLDQHFEAFEASLKAKEVTDDQVQLVVSRCKKLLLKAKITRLSSINGDLIAATLAAMREPPKEGVRGQSVQTSNHYIRAIKQFTRWLRLEKRFIDDPLARLEMLNVEVDRRHDRRALSDQDTSKLLAATLAGGVVLGFEPNDRHLLYVLALSTGLRASELASLKPDSLDLDVNPPTVTVRAGYSKRRRLDVLPLPSDILQIARTWLKTKMPGQPLWPGDWAEHRYAGKILQVDLKAAGIPYVDANGLFADFHSLRHTYITNLAKNGVPLVTAQKLARHSTPVLTARRYTHIDLHDQKLAVDRLPSLQRPLQRVDGFGRRETASDGTAGESTPSEKTPAFPAEKARKTGASKRRGGDSNSRATCMAAGFQDRCNRPLCHLSKVTSDFAIKRLRRAREEFSGWPEARQSEADPSTRVL